MILACVVFVQVPKGDITCEAENELGIASAVFNANGEKKIDCEKPRRKSVNKYVISLTFKMISFVLKKLLSHNHRSGPYSQSSTPVKREGG